MLLLLGYLFPSSFFSNQEQIRDLVQSYGALAPIAFIFVQILQVVVTPISHYVVSLAGGYIFGTWSGFFYNWIGRIIGTFIAFYLGRIFGRKIIRHVVKPETLQKYDHLFEKGKLLIFLMYFLPFFPDDELSYLAGFSSISIKSFAPLMILGHLGGSLNLAYIGSGVSYKDPLFIILTITTFVAGILFVAFYKKLKNIHYLPKR